MLVSNASPAIMFPSKISSLLCSSVILYLVCCTHLLVVVYGDDGSEPPEFQISRYVKLGDDFKPLYKGKVITRADLKLSDSAKLIKHVPDYYEPGEGPEEDDDILDDDEDVSGSSSSTTTTTTTTTTAAPTTTRSRYLHSEHVKLGADFKPLYKGRVISRHELNLTDAAKLIEPAVDYYEPGEGPEDDDEGDDYEPAEPSSTSKPSTTTTTTTTTPKMVTSPPSPPEKPFFAITDHIKVESDFKPLYKGRVISRNELNLTDSAKKINYEPDYYQPGEGPEDDDDFDDEEPVKKISEEVSKKASTPAISGLSTPPTKPPSPPEKPFFAITDHIKVEDDFKPLYKGRVISRNELNLTDSAKKINYEPDYYEPGEGPEDDDDLDDEVPVKKLPETSKETSKIAETSTPGTSGLSTPPTKPPSPPEKPYFAITDHVKVEDDFKPLYKGRVISRNELNLTDSAKKINYEPDYYEPGEGPDDDEDEDLGGEQIVDKTPKRPETTLSSTTTSTTTSATPMEPNNVVEYFDDKEQEDVDMAVGGISGIVQKIIQGPKGNEVNDQSSPEEVYIHLSNIVRDESSKAMKATIPRIYDYQYTIGELVSQRCFNAFAQFGDRLRKGYTWPLKMLSAGSRMSFNDGLRDYGDFDRCLDIVADDDERRPSEQFFTGQYCMMQLELPLPALAKNITYMDQVLHFNDTELGGTFAEFVSLNAPFLYSNPLSLGVCVPSSCLPSEIGDVLHYFLKKYHIKVKFTSDCYSKVNLTVTAMPGELVDMNVTSLLKDADTINVIDELNGLSSVQFWALIYFLISLTLVTLATLYESRQISRNGCQSWASSDRNRPKSFFACFSARYNLEQMTVVKERHMYEMANQSVHGECETDGATPKEYGQQHYVAAINTSVVDGLKVLALVWICISNYYFLGYQPQMLGSVANLRELILSLPNSAVFQLVTQSWLSMEIFFLLSGFLMAYTALPYIARRDGRPNLLFFIAKRILRFLPSVVFLLLFISLLPLWKNAGPLYNTGVDSLLEPCKRFYWRNIFFANNFYKYESTCLPHFWYISVEFQLTMIGIFVTVFAFNRSKQAWKVFVGLIVLGLVASGYAAFVRHINIAAPVFEKAILMEIPAIIKDVYFSTPVHFSAYFIGLAIGYYTRMKGLSSNALPKAIRYLLWIVLPLLTLVAVYLPQHWPIKADFKYVRAATALYYGVFRLLFIGTFAWILMECIHHRAGALKSLCSSAMFRILSQLSFQIYLLNVVIIWIYMFTKRIHIYPNAMDTLSVATSLFSVTVILALITYLLFEAPYRSLFRYYLESPRIISLMLPVSHVNGTKPSSSPQMYSKESMLNMNPNFLFSPHYNLVTNISSRADSEASSLANFSMGNHPTAPITINAGNQNPSIPKSISSISMTPTGDSERDFNNNRNPGEAY